MKIKITQQLSNLNRTVALFAVLLMCLSVTQMNAQVVLGYEFTSDLEGWDGNQARCSTAWNSAGYLDATTIGTNDPFFFNTTPVVLDTSNVNFLELSVQNGTSNAGGAIILIISGAPNVNIPITMTPNSAGFETIIVDLSTVANFSNSLVSTNVRIDPNNDGSAGTISYDYIRFVTTPTNVISPTSIAVTGPSAITTNETAQFTTSFTPSNTTFQDVAYTVNDMTIATIDASGLLSPLTAGTVTVTATTTDGSNVSNSQTVTITQGPNTIFGWEFDNDDEGWNSNPLRCTTAWNSAGYLDVTTEGTNDPSVRNANAVSFSAYGANFLEMSVRNGTSSTAGSIIFFVQGGGVRTLTFPMTANSTAFETITIDIPATVANWSAADVITDIRLDPNDNGDVGVISFDYFRFDNMVLSTDSEQLIDSTILYPNPVSQGENVFVSLERFTGADQIELSMRDLSGKLLYSKEVSGGRSEAIPTYNTRPGLYLISVKNDTDSKTFKIIVN